MNISTRLKLAGLFSLVAVSLIGLVLMSTTQQVKQELAKNETAGEISRAVTDIRYLTLEYVLRHEERARAQWQLRSTTLSKLLKSTRAFAGTEEQTLIDEVRDANESVNALFTQLMMNYESREISAERKTALDELETRLTGQISNQTQAMITDARNLSRRSRAGVVAAQQQASVAVTVLGGIVGLVIAAALFVILRRMTRSLDELREGTAIVGAGNLDFRLDVTTKDEVGELARAFNGMTEKLKGTTVSRDELVKANEELQTEITVRQQTEQKAQAQLERLDLLRQITRAIGERHDLKSIFQVVIRTVEDQLPIDFGCVCLYDRLDNSLTVTSVGVGSEVLSLELAMPEKAHIAIDENGLSRCVQGQLVYEPDVGEVKFPFPQRLARSGLRAVVMAPLLVESQVFGVLVAARRQAQSFSSGECEFLRQLSEHVALAAHQSQLYAALQQAYDDLRQTQQAVMQQERLRALGQMASGIAHDINNAISPVALYTESLLEREPNLSPNARSYLEIIQRAIDDVAQTVARMREFYRHREPQITLSQVQGNQLAQQVIDLTRARWSDMPQQRGIVIKLQTDLAPDLPAIMGSESEIREALINLVFNAVDAMPVGGTLTLRTKVVTDTQTPEQAPLPEFVRIEVTDTGAGMDDDTRNRCLEPFFTTKGERGTGLGLAMVYGVVQRHSAEIEIESAPGRGTTVSLSFSVPAAVVAGSTPSVKTGEMGPRLRLLVVDDDPLLLKSLRDTLEADGHVVFAANGGQAGIDAFRTAQGRGEKFAAVITDLGMPHIDGRKVAESIRTASPSTPIIMLTGWGQRLIANGDTPPHVDRVLNKPPKLRELREVLAHYSAEP